MIELPEAITIARQINVELKGKMIADGNRGNAPHKFAFYSQRSPDEYAELFEEKTIAETTVTGGLILVSLAPEHMLVLGGGGERIVYHRSSATLPKKYQLYLHFTDDTYLTVTVQGWGSALLLHQSEVSSHWMFQYQRGSSPLSEEFTLDYFNGLFTGLKQDDPSSVKYFIISKPGVQGIGNGCLQDILWRAKIHPRRRAIGLTEAEKKRLYTSIRTTLQQMVDGGGRDGDFDLYDHPGGYPRVLHSKAVGLPCPDCGAPIEKAAFLGGAIYYCPSCQVI
jgi:formamidopyrimidine-DNA glycosylase